MAENTQTAKLRVMEEANFRELYHRYQYIECPEDMDALKNAFTVMEGATGILTYCYIEEGLGLSFYILCSAKMDGTELEAGPDVTAQMARVRYGDVCYKKFLVRASWMWIGAPLTALRRRRGSSSKPRKNCAS